MCCAVVIIPPTCTVLHQHLFDQSTEPKMFICNLRDKSFKTNKILKRHTSNQYCLKPRPIGPKCKDCNKQFKSDRHMESHGDKCSPKDKIFICDFCEHVFKDRKIMNRHIARQKCKSKCDGCKKEFRNPEQLRTHDLYCEAKPCVCSVCSKIFSNKHKMNAHFVMHVDEKPFPCCFCETFIKRASYLKVHLRIHTDERPFKCSDCDAAFKTANARRMH